MTTRIDDSGEMQQDILTVEQAAAFLKVPKPSLYTYANRGQVPSIRLGKHVRFRMTDLQAWMDQQVRKRTGRI